MTAEEFARDVRDYLAVASTSQPSNFEACIAEVLRARDEEHAALLAATRETLRAVEAERDRLRGLLDTAHAVIGRADAEVTRLRTALEGIPCPQCNGKKYSLDRCPKCFDPAYWEDGHGCLNRRDCTACEGTGIHPRARAALAAREATGGETALSPATMKGQDE